MTPDEGEMDDNAFGNDGEFFTALTGLQRTTASFRSGHMLDTQAGLPPDTAHFSVLEVQNGNFDGYIIARPFRQIAPGQFEPDPHHWWVFDSDLDESDAAWVPQAEFTPDGFINHGHPPYPPDDFYFSGGNGFNGQPPLSNAPDAGRLDEGLDPDEGEPNDEGGGGFLDDDPSPPAPRPTPRDPNTPPSNIHDILDDADDKRISQWRRVGSFEVLESPLGTAFLCSTAHPAVGLIRYTDGVCVEITGSSCDEIRHRIPGALRDRPVTMQTLDLDEEEALRPAEERKVDPLADTEPPKKPSPRKWTTVSIRGGVEDD